MYLTWRRREKGVLFSCSGWITSSAQTSGPTRNHVVMARTFLLSLHETKKRPLHENKTLFRLLSFFAPHTVMTVGLDPE